MNLMAFFTPGQRANAPTFFAGLLTLGILDAVRIWALQQELPFEGVAAVIVTFGSLFVMVLFVLFLFMNRRRDAERGTGLAFLPVLVSLAIKGIAVFAIITVLSMGLMGEFAESQGQDMMTAAQDPAFNAQFQAWIEADPERQSSIAAATLAPAFLGFWIPLALFGLWFGSMKPEVAE